MIQEVRGLSLWIGSLRAYWQLGWQTATGRRSGFEVGSGIVLSRWGHWVFVVRVGKMRLLMRVWVAV